MITGEILKNALISGANNIKKYKQSIDELNVFPVPDGDTGTNMHMTISMAAKEIRFADDNLGVFEISKIFSDALLRNARGNSGVILSLIFRGISKSLTDKTTATTKDLAFALESGSKTAYDVVMKPTEGTILTVIRKTAEGAKEIASEVDDITEFWSRVCEIASQTLDQTPDMLPVLKKAGVVDSGGKGLLVILEGMKSVFEDNIIIDIDGEETEIKKDVSVRYVSNNMIFDYSVKYGYCTEFIIYKENNERDVKLLRAYLESIGDSVLVIDDDNIIKIHVHTNDPGLAITKAIEYGQLVDIKIDNERQQCGDPNQNKNQVRECQNLKNCDDSKEQVYLPVDENIEYGFVSVAAGDGLHSLFKDLGVNNIVSGGQTMNPSTDDILKAIHSTPAKTVFVLPNNKNIIMAAEQAANLADRNVCVLQSRTIPQGLSAMLAFDFEMSFEENRLAMTQAIDNVSTGQITFAARDSDFNGHKIKNGDILALANSKLLFTERDINKACVKLIKNLLKKDSIFITLIYGQDVTEAQVEELKKFIKSKISDDIELNIVYGGQPVYYYIISVE
ncbi:MAG: DAK2 domain-containing protein [Oscillospiraceae bacterium]|nr:DAK2 domain-containing protein [Oscillospiraceae bacterium]